VILNVTQVHANVHAWGDLVVLVASLREAAEDIRLAAEKAIKSQTVPANSANTAEERVGVIFTHHKHFILDSVRLKFQLANNRTKGIDNVVTAGS
jgi:hypothetical protein